jgi:hypothetical protein
VKKSELMGFHLAKSHDPIYVKFPRKAIGRVGLTVAVTVATLEV